MAHWEKRRYDYPIMEAIRYLRGVIFLALVVSGMVIANQAMAAGSTVSSAKEYFSANPDGRLTIAIQVWGGVSLAGIHHVPDTTTLGELVGITGGPTGGSLERTTIRLRRRGVDLDHDTTIEFEGENFLVSRDGQDTPLHEGDVVYFDVEPTRDPLVLTSTILGLITSVLLTIFLIREKF